MIRCGIIEEPLKGRRLEIIIMTYKTETEFNASINNRIMFKHEIF